MTFSPDTAVKPGAFAWCPSLAVLAASVGFELDTGDSWGNGNWNDPTNRITLFAKWRNQIDGNNEYYKSAMGMLELPNTPLCGNVRMRASTEDPIWVFVAGSGRDIAKLILSHTLWVMVGKTT